MSEKKYSPLEAALKVVEEIKKSTLEKNDKSVDKCGDVKVMEKCGDNKVVKNKLKKYNEKKKMKKSNMAVSASTVPQTNKPSIAAQINWPGTKKSEEK